MFQAFKVVCFRFVFSGPKLGDAYYWHENVSGTGVWCDSGSSVVGNLMYPDGEIFFFEGVCQGYLCASERLIRPYVLTLCISKKISLRSLLLDGRASLCLRRCSDL